MRGVLTVSVAGSLFAVLLALAACGKSDDNGQKDGGQDSGRQNAAAGVAPGVVLNPAEVKGLGITIAATRPVQYRAEAGGYGTVVPLDTIAQADSDLVAARAVAAQSRAEADRDIHLFRDQNGAISRQAMEVAIAKAGSDAAAVSLAARKAQAAFGLSPPWNRNGQRAAIMARLASGAEVMVRVSFPLGVLSGALPGRLSISRLGGTRRWDSGQTWRAPADPAFPGETVFALVGGSDLTQNEHVIAHVPQGPPQTGLAVPAGAVVYGEGASWVFVAKGSAKGKNRFVRVPVDTSRVLEGGYFVSAGAGLAPGDGVVTGGAGLLLARTLNPATAPAD